MQKRMNQLLDNRGDLKPSRVTAQAHDIQENEMLDCGGNDLVLWMILQCPRSKRDAKRACGDNHLNRVREPGDRGKQTNGLPKSLNHRQAVAADDARRHQKIPTIRLW